MGDIDLKSIKIQMIIKSNSQTGNDKLKKEIMKNIKNEKI